jgi:hypothetical protein
MVCIYCATPLSFNDATKDHLTPTCRGGTDKISNIAPACLSCNQAKGWRTEEEFRLYISTKHTARARNTYIKPSPALEETINEPGLLKKLTNERERVSWAWRNATTKPRRQAQNP